MPEKRDDITIFSLAEVARSIQKTVSERYKQAYWIKAEMNKLNHYSHSGHCYPELVEKGNGKVITEMRGILWKSDYERINETFIKVTGDGLTQGINILFLANIQYDPIYGLSLRILEIDPSYSLGILELEKQNSITKLKKEGLYHANKKVPFPLLPKRLAVISVETSKGYADFLKIIQTNPHKYLLEHTLFPALLQGHRAVTSIIGQLSTIKNQLNEFDVVLIIRGGGGEVGLTSYNHYELAAAVASFPIPVLTGIGHATNETVTEMVAYKQAITPSELADFLLQKFHTFALQVQNSHQLIKAFAPTLIDEQQVQLRSIAQQIQDQVKQLILMQHHQLTQIQWSFRHQLGKRMDQARHTLFSSNLRIQLGTKTFFNQRQQQLFHQERLLNLVDPKSVLKRGYSLTYYKGKVLTNSKQINVGDPIETHLFEGIVQSTIDTKTKNNE